MKVCVTQRMLDGNAIRLWLVPGSCVLALAKVGAAWIHLVGFADRECCSIRLRS
jgi:hypothetical protein